MGVFFVYKISNPFLLYFCYAIRLSSLFYIERDLSDSKKIFQKETVMSSLVETSIVILLISLKPLFTSKLLFILYFDGSLDVSYYLTFKMK